MHSDVIILGAGMAGLSAARALAEAGIHVHLLEATDRIGGRIHTDRSTGQPIELGAEFVHGQPPDLLALIAEAGLQVQERTGDFLTVANDRLTPEPEDTEDSEDPLQLLESYTGPDQTFAEYLTTLHLPCHQARRSFSYVEGFNAADATQASILALARQQQAEDAIEGDRNFRLPDGYDQLPAFLLQRAEAAGAHLSLNTSVGHIAWMKAHVQAGPHTANALIATVPLPILQTLTFTPVIPSITDPANALRMGQVCRVTLLFDRAIWPEKMSFLLTPKQTPSVWWTTHPAATHLVTGWLGGPRSADLLALSKEELESHVLQALSEALNLSLTALRQDLLSLHTLNWEQHSTTRGAYSWVPIGALEASLQLTVPVANTLFFAGEHTDVTGHWGTVHAAHRSGLRAANQLLSSR